MNYLGLSEKEVTPTAKSLNTLLANYHLYYQNLRAFHWNVSGENFFELHEQFEALYNDARLKIDEIAERILTLRMLPMSHLSDYLEQADIKEASAMNNDRQMVETILENHRILIGNMRRVINTADEINDEGTIDLIGGFLSELEKKSWMLDAWKAKKLEGVIA